jgi:uncharacterized membrane protein YdcZ (DUF606 family)
MSIKLRQDVVLGFLLIAAGVLAIVLWVPADTGTGIIEKVRGKYRAGDALAPTVAFVILIISGILLILESRVSTEIHRISRRHLKFALISFFVFVMSIALMRWSGPLALFLSQYSSDNQLQYRELRDTAPWKYIGFLLGGSVLVGAFISLASRQQRLTYYLIGLIASAMMIALYDLPFDNLLLPPNGDV